MLTEERHQLILAAVKDEGVARTFDLCRTLGVSEATVRRDLERLDQLGLIERVRGGAVAPRRHGRPEVDHTPFSLSSTAETAQKRTIAQLAAGRVIDGDVIILDIGTTVAAMCPLLRERRITVITASLAVIQELADCPSIDLIILGGHHRPTYSSMVGPLTEHALSQLRAGTAFIGCSGIESSGAVLDTTPSEVPIKRLMLENAQQAFLLADAKKMPGEGVMEVAPLSRFRALVTDQTPHHLSNYFSSLADNLTPEVIAP
ncbi:DeoR/GlpR family DNA-binding transcription regulator [Helcobacillus massiliensis]|uniref:DeoR/GlpR family transcriptional regulator of sugar metabolism n=1 Tax=Helcobacillus massiliensis TaxID=521392 RepID=A0A839R029_9MICO|nr:DeoR/GlpR family DNA-binding transcription regulator [Helcobacillus massiliensis]MBB3023571.1 DeoR/GlpR family transcriptional regulator of sugar metabolism [Helcobacillus massiliensis]MCT1557576.1 DeoR/GlpR family DNA-binding transcription regulator [Helcobacillus massiliensis]MCT2036801.1 DeoR/GlpR family DNA-binding transcription regulator [Helcobacillus massiliensis]MCT2332446.1 DeoR/GlpR family DNA-binding transcription regulator [Helcobacillus massiliensis]